MKIQWIKFSSSIALGTVLVMPLMASAANVEAIRVEDMLVYAMQDEISAKAEYEALIDEFGSIRPITNILRAELRHIDALAPLLEAYGVDVGDFTPTTVIPSSLEEAYQIGVDAKIKNMALYQNYLSTELPVDVEAVFNRLATASTHHLDAFQRQLDNDGIGFQRGSQGRNVQRGNSRNVQTEDCVND